jgi:hypothetical protein
MKQEWHVSRTFIERTDGQRRWDYAFQFLLRWAMEQSASVALAPSHQQENQDEDSLLCSCFDQSPTTESDH